MARKVVNPGMGLSEKRDPAKTLELENYHRKLIGRRIRERRLKRGWSLRELSRQMCLDDDFGHQAGHVTVLRWEQGTYAPSAFTLVLLGQIFKCSVDYLLGASNNPRLKNKPRKILGEPLTFSPDDVFLIHGETQQRAKLPA